MASSVVALTFNKFSLKVNKVPKEGVEELTQLFRSVSFIDCIDDVETHLPTSWNSAYDQSVDSQCMKGGSKGGTKESTRVLLYNNNIFRIWHKPLQGLM